MIDSVNARILVVGPAWVGDMVMAQALFRRLRVDDAACVIDVVAPRWTLPIVARMPEVRSGIELALGHGEFGFGVRRALGHSLRAGHYSRAIVLPNSWKSALVPFFAGIPRRTGYAREARLGLLNDLRPLDKARLKTTVERFVALAGPRGETALPAILPPQLVADAENGAAAAVRLALPDGPAVALMPGAEYGPAKRWPVEYFTQLARLLGRDGVRSWVFGSPKETVLGEAITQGSGGAAVNLCGRTGLGDVVDLVARCRAVVTNDSGLMHVSAAAGVPVVAIYGSSTPDFTPPLTERKAIHYLRLSCSPCFERECPLGHLDCLRKIAPEVVRESLKTLADI
ncbi:MAG: lipopolysaccharide heptosyltransferase II [Nevskiaceae bacterium]|nr:MAG: lipopolysaccharide heptosyltransferase II [Nevskiaceae bacterium]TBR71404.1 MAG: lipopolysaccharide heptosyltransferase II [Nevskiaceae bacterium]